MSRVDGNRFIFEREEPAICEMCGKKDELRPYGPGGMNVCYECAMEDEEEAIRQFEKRIGHCDTFVDKSKH